MGAEHFRAAADYLRTYGWRSWSIGQHGKPRCAVGALRSVALMCEETRDDRRTLSRRLTLTATRYLNRLQPFGHRTGLMTFNDLAGKKRVIGLFDDIADYIERHNPDSSLAFGSGPPGLARGKRGGAAELAAVHPRTGGNRD